MLLSGRHCTIPKFGTPAAVQSRGSSAACTAKVVATSVNDTGPNFRNMTVLRGPDRGILNCRSRKREVVFSHRRGVADKRFLEFGRLARAMRWGWRRLVDGHRLQMRVQHGTP